MADIRENYGIITEVVAGEEGDGFEGEPSTPNRIVMTIPKWKWPATIGWFGHSELCEQLNEWAMAGVKVKVTYLHTDPVKGSDGEERRYRNLIKAETKDGEVVEVPGAGDAAEFAGSGTGGGKGQASGGAAAASSGEALRVMALDAAATVLGHSGALTGKWAADLTMVTTHAREILRTCGADEAVLEGFDDEDPDF